MTTELYSGSASIGTTEYSLTNNSTTLASRTTAVDMQAFVDVSAMTATEQYRLRVYEKVTSGGTQRTVFDVLLTGEQQDPINVLDRLLLLNGWDVSLQKIAGTDRTISWSIRDKAAGGGGSDPWATALPGAYTAGQAGYIVGTNLDATTSSRASAADLATVNNNVDAILIDTDSAIPAQIAALSIPSAASIADAVCDEPLSGHATNGTLGKALSDVDLRGSRTVLRGTCASGGTTTTFTASALDPSGTDADQFKGRIIVFDKDTATAALRGQATDITANTAAALPAFTFTALTAAPASGDTFSIV
jgi:hypothetical protein